VPHESVSQVLNYFELVITPTLTKRYALIVGTGLDITFKCRSHNAMQTWLEITN